MDSSESTRTWALLLLAGAGTSGALRTGKDAAGGDDDDLAVGELLLKFPGETVRRWVVSLAVAVRQVSRMQNIPLLDLVETLEKGNWDEDHNGLLSLTGFDLCSNRQQLSAFQNSGTCK